MNIYQCPLTPLLKHLPNQKAFNHMDEEIDIAELIRKLAIGENKGGVTLTQMECAAILDRLGDDLVFAALNP